MSDSDHLANHTESHSSYRCVNSNSCLFTPTHCRLVVVNLCTQRKVPPSISPLKSATLIILSQFSTMTSIADSIPLEILREIFEHIETSFSILDADITRSMRHDHIELSCVANTAPNTPTPRVPFT